MNFKIINPVDIPDWNRQVAELPEATIFHSANWSKVLEDVYGYTPVYFCAVDNGKINAVLPVMEIKSFLTGKRGVSLPFSDHVNPLASNRDIFEQLFNNMVLYARDRGWKTISFHGGASFFSGVKTDGEYLSCTTKLGCEAGSLLGNLKGSTRRNIAKAEKSGVKAKISSSLKSVKEFYRLNCLTRRDHGLPPQPFFFFRKIYDNIIQKKMGFISLGYFEGKPISGVLFFIFNGKALYKYGASDKKYLPYRPNNLVFWKALKYAQNQGVSEVNLGRTELHHKGLLQYKRGWNPEESYLNYFKYDIAAQNFVNSSAGLKSSYVLFSRLPITVLKIAGKILYKHVG